MSRVVTVAATQMACSWDRQANIANADRLVREAAAKGAHPYIVCQLHWHGVDNKPLLEKMGIDHEKAWAEFEAQADRIKSGEIDYISWEEADA